jgi:hypothetical protein
MLGAELPLDPRAAAADPEGDAAAHEFWFPRMRRR